MLDAGYFSSSYFSPDYFGGQEELPETTSGGAFKNNASLYRARHEAEWVRKDQRKKLELLAKEEQDKINAMLNASLKSTSEEITHAFDDKFRVLNNNSAIISIFMMRRKQ